MVQIQPGDPLRGECVRFASAFLRCVVLPSPFHCYCYLLTIACYEIIMIYISVILVLY